MKKIIISKLFLYRYRFHIGYIMLGLAFLGLIFLLPLLSPNGLSEAEMTSTVESYSLHLSSVSSGDLVDLPYHILQKLSILILGFNAYAIKLPSIIIAAVLGILLILLLNRWFKSNVALLASVITILSVPFLYLAGTGTPLIMLVFWPTLLLWLGSKIQGEKKPRPSYCFLFAFMLLLSIFTPHMIYLAIFIVLLVLLNPHLRFTVKTLPRFPFILTCIIIVLGLGSLIINIIGNPDVVIHLLFAKDYEIGNYFNNISEAFIPFFSWNSNVEGTLLTPLVGLPALFLAFAGLSSTVKGFFASRNSIATYLLIFTILLSGFNPDSSLLAILPLSILIAHGFQYILEKWYGLFPENPYARVLGILPISCFISIMILSGLSHFIFGYRYAPAIANNFNNDLELVSQLPEGTQLLVERNTIEYEFYSAYEDRTKNIEVLTDVPANIPLDTKLATLGKSTSAFRIPGRLVQIITSPKSDNSDRLYIYVSKNTK